MKTTVELPDNLLRRAKAEAATQGITLKEFFQDAIQRKLLADSATGQPSWRQLSGDLASLREETGRICEVINEEFEKIDVEDAP